MINRYSDERIANIWSDEYRFGFYQQIELKLIEYFSENKDVKLSNPQPNIKNIKNLELKTRHEVVAFLKDMQSRLTKNEHKAMLHYGLTSSDIIDTTFSYQIRESLNVLITELQETLNILSNRIKEFSNLSTLGRTHGRIAEQMPLSMRFQHLKEEILYCTEFLTTKGLVGKLKGPVGHSHLDPQDEKTILNSLDLRPATFTTQIIPRHHYAQVMSSMAILAACFERFAISIRLLSIDEVNEWSETKTAGQYGSSSMPHKTNPVLSERICGLSRIIRSNSNAAIENIPLWLERDISHSSVERIIWPDSFHLLLQIIKDMNQILKKLSVNTQNILEKNTLYEAKSSSHKQMLALQEQGKSRFEAYECSSKQVNIQEKD